MGEPTTARSRTWLTELNTKLQPIETKTIEVREGDWDVNTGITIQQGDTLIFQAWGQIMSGVFLTGPNGPNGWNNIDDDPKFPLPGTHPYCLLGKLDSGYFFVGEYLRMDNLADQGDLYLRINDDQPGNGGGAFTCQIQHARP